MVRTRGPARRPDRASSTTPPARLTGATFRAPRTPPATSPCFAQTADRVRTAGGHLLGPPRHLRQGSEPAADARRAADRQARLDPGRAGPRRGRHRLDRGPQRHRARAGSSGHGARSRTASLSSYGSRRSRRSRRPTRSCRASWPGTTTRFMVPAADPEPAWRPWPDGLSAAAVFCFDYPRRVARDATVSWPSGPLALPSPVGRSRLGGPVGRPPGAARRQPVGQPRRDLCAGRPGTGGPGHPARPRLVPPGGGP